MPAVLNSVVITKHACYSQGKQTDGRTARRTAIWFWGLGTFFSNQPVTKTFTQEHEMRCAKLRYRVNNELLNRCSIRPLWKMSVHHSSNKQISNHNRATEISCRRLFYLRTLCTLYCLICLINCPYCVNSTEQWTVYKENETSYKEM